MNISINDRITELENELKAVRELARMESEALRESVVPEYVYTVAPIDDKFDRIYDESVVQYRIEGVCTNKEACEAVGRQTHTGGMTYLFNRASGKIIGAFGGGTVFISGRGFARHTDEVDATMLKLSAWIDANPAGGDITKIIEAHRASVAKS